MADNKISINIEIPEHFTAADKKSVKEAIEKMVKGTPLKDAAGNPVDVATVDASVTPNKFIQPPNK